MDAGVQIAIITGIATILATAINKYGPQIFAFITRKNKNEKYSKEIQADAEISNFINQQLNNLLYETSADRVFVLNITNGGVLVPTKKSFKKINMTFEILAPNVSSVKSYFQDIPIYFFSCPINKLKEKSSLIVEDFKDISDDSSIKGMVLEHDTRAMFCSAIKNKDGVICAILGVSFNEPKKFDNEEETDKITAYSNIISGLMMSLLAH